MAHPRPSNGSHHEVLERVRNDNVCHDALELIDEGELMIAIEQLYRRKELKAIVDLKQLKRGALRAKNTSLLKPPKPEDSEDQTNNNTTTNTNRTADDAHTARGADSAAVNCHALLPDEEKYLTLVEEAALLREGDATISSLTKGLIVTFLTCAIGAVIQGWSQQSIVGANLNWPVDLHIATRLADGSLRFKQPNGLTLFSLVNAIPYFAASVLGAWISDPLTARYGRRSALLFAGLCSFAAPIGGAYSRTWYHLFVCRLIQGIGMGAKSSVVPILESEVSPPKMRGKLLVSWQTFVAVGILLGALTNCIFAGQWRYQLGIAFVPALTLLCLCYTVVESPRWLVKKGDYKNAYKALLNLRETPLQACRDLYLIHAQLRIEHDLFTDRSLDRMGIERYKGKLKDETRQDNIPPADFNHRLRQLFTIPRNRHAVVGSCIVMAAQQFCGINIFAFLATTIFGDSDFNDMKTLWFTLGFGGTNAVFSASAYFLINKLGRRTLLLCSLILMFPFLITTGHYLAVNSDRSPSTAAVIVLVLIYTAIYSPGAGVIPFMYASEVFPVVHREAGMSLAVSVNFALAGVLAMTVPLYSNTGNKQLLLGIFALLDGFAAIMVWLYMRSPEEAMSLEEMNYLFLKPSICYIRYQVIVVLPWVPFWFSGAPKPSFDEWYNDPTLPKTIRESLRSHFRRNRN